MNKEEQRFYQREWRKAHKEQVKESRYHWRETHKEHICKYNALYRQTHSEQIGEPKRRQCRQGLKITILTHYGNGKCNCIICGENRIDCLSIDHIDGGGTQHRRELRVSGMHFYQWLKKQEFPNGYRTLCMNCQFVEAAKYRRAKKGGQNRST